MAARKPIVVGSNGLPQQLQSGDTVDGLVIGTNVQAYSANLDEYAAVNPTSAGLALLDDADAWAQRETLGLNLIRAQQDLQLANLTTGLVDFLNAFADGFNNTAGIDSGNSTNYTTAAGYVTPSIPTSGGTSTTGASTTGVATLVDMSFSLTNGATVHQVGIYSAASGTGDLKIYHNDNPGTNTQFDILYSQSFTHTGGGWNYFTLGTPFVVPGTAHHLGYFPTTGMSTTGLAVLNRSFKASNQGVGNNNTGWFYDTVAGMCATQAVYSPNNMDLRSVSRVITLSPPTIADVYALVEETDALTPNTDLILYASRNGNTTYVTGTASELGTLANGLVLYAATAIDLTGQGSASNLRWKVTTANNKNCKVHAIGVYAR